MKVTFIEVREGKAMQYRPLAMADGKLGIAKTMCGTAVMPEAAHGKRLLVNITQENEVTGYGISSEVVLGYTDRGIDTPETISPDTRIYFNRLLRGELDPTSSDLVLRSVGQMFTHPVPLTGWSGEPIPATLRKLRPEDVMSELEFREMTIAQAGDREVNAMPILTTPTMFDGRYAELSTYLEMVQTTLTAAKLQVEDNGTLGLMGSSTIGLCRDNLRSPPVVASRVLMVLLMNTKYRENGYVTYQELQGIDNDAEVKVIAMGGDSEVRPESYGWDNDEPETVLCARLEAELPSRILNLGLSTWGCTVTRNATGVTVSTYTASELNKQSNLTSVVFSLEARLFDILNDHAIDMTSMDIFVQPDGESKYTLKLNDGTERTYIAPSYADAMYSSYLTPDKSYYDNLVQEVEHLLAP